MTESFTILGGIGTIFLLIVAVLAFLSPIFFYLIQRNTFKTMQELATTNNNLLLIYKLLVIINEKQENNVNKIKQQPDNEKPMTVIMECPECKKQFKYGVKHSGTYKNCPGCEKRILLK